MEQRRKLERWLDAGMGECHLRRPDIARIVETRLLISDGEECLLFAWTIMPNHVHVLCEISDDLPMDKLLQAWKGPTSRAVNERLGRHGTLWAREYHVPSAISTRIR
ncbi:hypothetical protein EON79_15385 [bacterium]|nr:MAG: hypothetical protein EON79_15385 [bacterium]